MYSPELRIRTSSPRWPLLQNSPPPIAQTPRHEEDSHLVLFVYDSHMVIRPLPIRPSPSSSSSLENQRMARVYLTMAFVGFISCLFATSLYSACLKHEDPESPSLTLSTIKLIGLISGAFTLISLAYSRTFSGDHASNTREMFHNLILLSY